MIYIALLRGINVGGNNKIDMKQLKATFERVGMKDVVTYINTGNIIFNSEMQLNTELAAILEAKIQTDFGLQIKVVVRSFEQFSRITEALPPDWTNGPAMKSDVLFLWDEVDHESSLEQLVIKPEIDRVLYVPGAILWSVDREHVTKSGMQKLIGTKLYSKVTVRNVNTTRKIYELMKAAGH
ncbi:MULTISPECIES: DUF1697 domain-containing protein [Paenibacillus]|uniref:DUF1697 domain-containing protein n=1 Tax=Paenibacillus TaxID=44249 RepID=UPI002FE36572